MLTFASPIITYCMAQGGLAVSDRAAYALFVQPSNMPLGLELCCVKTLIWQQPSSVA